MPASLQLRCPTRHPLSPNEPRWGRSHEQGSTKPAVSRALGRRHLIGRWRSRAAKCHAGKVRSSNWRMAWGLESRIQGGLQGFRIVIDLEFRVCAVQCILRTSGKPFVSADPKSAFSFGFLSFAPAPGFRARRSLDTLVEHCQILGLAAPLLALRKADSRGSTNSHSESRRLAIPCHAAVLLQFRVRAIQPDTIPPKHL